VTTLKKSVSGVINSSLYESLEKESADPRLTMKLADVYAWTIDFYDIKKGDWYKVEYEEKYVNGKAIETGNISSAVFHHDGETFYAFYFQPDSAKEGHYYDEHARSLRKAFLKAPLKFIRITSHYTLRRFHPVQKRWKAHLGTDYGAPTGTPIMTTGDGVVIASTFSRFNGNYVKVRHNATYTTQYLHKSKRADRVGQHVKQGQVIGYVGSTGLATGPHVCYRFWKNGKQVDPLKQHFPAAEPVPQDEMQLFQQMVQRQEQTLADVGLDTAKTSV
jgi:murein DD-endopeptidase MepM/ murein hydrolase activator NlpD